MLRGEADQRGFVSFERLHIVLHKKYMNQMKKRISQDLSNLERQIDNSDMLRFTFVWNTVIDKISGCFEILGAPLFLGTR